tara:strand:+ start:382 stop:564 length:183 start_codon:yes stop_codon:yes gene_type:complete
MSEIVFNDSYKAQGFENGLELINNLLKVYKIKINYKFIEDYVSNEGEYAYIINIEENEDD